MFSVGLPLFFVSGSDVKVDLASFNSTSSATSPMSFANMAMGTRAKIVIAWRDQDDNSSAVTSIVVGGITATQLYNLNHNGFWIVDNPNPGGTATVTLNGSGLQRSCVILWSVDGIQNAGAYSDLKTTASSPATASVIVPAGGAIFCISHPGNVASSATFSGGITEDVDTLINGQSARYYFGGHGEFAAAATANPTITFSGTASTNRRTTFMSIR